MAQVPISLGHHPFGHIYVIGHEHVCGSVSVLQWELSMRRHNQRIMHQLRLLPSHWTETPFQIIVSLPFLGRWIWCWFQLRIFVNVDALLHVNFHWLILWGVTAIPFYLKVWEKKLISAFINFIFSWPNFDFIWRISEIDSFSNMLNIVNLLGFGK